MKTIESSVLDSVTGGNAAYVPGHGSSDPYSSHGEARWPGNHRPASPGWWPEPVSPRSGGNWPWGGRCY